MKLNSKKHIFEIKAEKFVGYIISERDIEVNPENMNIIKIWRHSKL